MSPRLSTATSVVPPPMSTTMEPVGSVIGMPAPMAAAMGSAISPPCRAPADSTDWRMARFSTGVAPWGTQTMIFGLVKVVRLCTLRMKCLIISSAVSKSAITPSRIGRIASIEPGVRPSISLASSPNGQHLLDAVLDVIGRRPRARSGRRPCP
jgi:hypothetical protein